MPKALLRYLEVTLGAFSVTCLAAALMTETGRTVYGVFIGVITYLTGLTIAALEEN